MKQLFAFLMCVASLSAVAQINYPYNPDEDANGQIENNDLLGFLTVYGNTFAPGEPTLAGCNYTGWAIQAGSPAVFLMNEVIPEGYSYASNQICAANIVLSDPYCINNSWDITCQSAYEACIQQGGCEMTLSAYLSSLSIRLDSLAAAIEPMDDLIIPGSLTVNQNITVGGGFALGSLSVGNFIDSTAIQFDSLETFVDTTHVRLDSLETFMDSALVRLDTLESRTPLQGKPGYDGNSSLWRNVATGTNPTEGRFTLNANMFSSSILVNTTNHNNTDMAGWLSVIDAGDLLTIRNSEETENEAYFQVFSSVALPISGLWSIDLDPLSSSEDFFPLDTTDYFIGYSRQGEPGPVGYQGVQGEPGNPGTTSGLGFNWKFTGSLYPGEGTFNVTFLPPSFSQCSIKINPVTFGLDGLPIDFSPLLYNFIEEGDILYIKTLSSQSEITVFEVTNIVDDPYEQFFLATMVFTSNPTQLGGTPLMSDGETYFIGIDKN